MRKHIFILTIGIFGLFLAGCGDQDSIEEVPVTPEGQHPGENEGGKDNNGDIPDGHFEAVFSSPLTRAPITGQDNRIKDILYLLYNNSTKAFIKERKIKLDENQEWPVVVKDTLPKGTIYKAFFFGNVDKELHAYTDSDNTVYYQDIVENYEEGYDKIKVRIPNIEMESENELYKGDVTFSEGTPNPSVLLQRIIGIQAFGRAKADPEYALDTLAGRISWSGLYRRNVNVALDDALTSKLNKGTTTNPTYWSAFPGGYSSVKNLLYNAFRESVMAELHDDQYVTEVKKRIGLSFVGTQDHATLIDFLEKLINPWHYNDVHAAIFSTTNYAISSSNTNLWYGGEATNNNYLIDPENPTPVDDFKLQYKFKPGPYGQKDLILKTFGSSFLTFIMEVVSEGLPDKVKVGNNEYQSYLMKDDYENKFMDMEILSRGLVHSNKRYKALFNFEYLTILDNTKYTANPITVSLRLGDLPNYSTIITKLRINNWSTVSATIINTHIHGNIQDMIVTAKLNLPSLALSNIDLYGKWDNIDGDQQY